MSKFKVKNPPLWKYALGVILLVVTVFAFQFVLAGIGVSLAAIFTSSVVEKGSGKLGKDVIVGGKNGPFLRLRVKPSNPKTQAQMNSRSVTVQLSREWRGLAATAMASFNSLASVTPIANKLGFKRTISGFQLFMKINKPLLMAGVSPILSAPTGYQLENGTLMPSFPVATVTYDPTTKLLKTFTLNFSSLPVGLGPTYLVLKMTALISPGITSYKCRRYVPLLTTNTTSITEPIDVFAAFTAKYGTPSNTIPQQIFLEFYQIDSSTGSMCAKQYCPINMVPPTT